MADITAYQRQDNYETRLTSPYSTGDASLTVNTLPSFALASGTYFLTIAPGTTDQVTVECSTVTNPITISGIVPNFEGGSNPSGITHPAGTKVIISNPWHSISEMKDAMNAKLNVDEDDTIAADTTWSITTKAGVKVNNLTTAQRTAITPTNGEVVYDTDLGQMFFGEGGAWVANASGTSVSNASTTVAGKVEEATDAEVGAGTAAGGTGARLFVNPGSVVKTSSGAGDENKLVALEADGKFADGFQNISEANATTLTNGSDADSLHVHDIITLGIDGSKLYYLGNIPFTEMETNDSGTPTLTHYGGFTNFATSAGSGDRVVRVFRLPAPNASSNSHFQWDDLSNGDVLTFAVQAKFSSETQIEWALGLKESANFQDITSSDQNEVMIVSNDGSETSSVNDASGSPTQTAITATSTNWNTYKIVWTVGTNALFYVNGSLVDTRSSDLPDITSTSDIYVGFCVETTETSAKNADFSRIWFSYTK